jgi:hypothetical protein
MGASYYVRIPMEWMRAHNLGNGDLAFLSPIKDNKFEVTLMKLPRPQEAEQQQEMCEAS